MANYIDPTTAPGGIALRLAGAVANPLVHAAYPAAPLAQWHALRHLPGLTGRWMDTGATALGGAVRGSYHRLSHGHHLFDDGLKVVRHPELKFGEFLHHLGLDALTARGIPNPLIPKAVGEWLMRSCGLTKATANELLTLNLPKVLGGGLALVCSGADVWLAFSDAIPHTFAAAGIHAAMGAATLVFGCYPPNPLMLLAGAAEMGVSAATAWRAWCDPIIPALGLPKSVFLPMLGQAVLTSGLLGAALGTVFAGGLAVGAKNGVAAACGAAAATTAGTMAKAAGLAAVSLPALLAGPAAFLVVRRLLDLLTEPGDPATLPEEVLAVLDERNCLARNARIIPALAIPERPFARFQELAPASA